MTKDISSIPTVGWDGHPDGPLVFLQDHEAHVTRLQAELDKATRAKKVWSEMAASREKERDALKDELTKARNLLVYASGLIYAQKQNSMSQDLLDAIYSFFNQSAPADKGQDEPVAIGTLRRDENERIVFDAIGDPHIKDGMPVYTDKR